MESVTPSLAGAVVIRPAAAAPVTAGKDSRWLTLEVCREFARTHCPRSADECKYAHPPPHVEIQNGRVTCCYDSIKGKCQRTNPPCKYLHPPAHLQEQLLQTGKQNLAMKNIHAQAVAAASGLQPVFHMAAQTPAGMYPLVYGGDSVKSVLPSPYQAMMMPGQYQYMPSAQQYLLPGAAAPAGGCSPYQLYQPSPAGPVIQLVDAVTGATMPLPTAQHASPNLTANHTPLSSLAAANQLEVPVWNALNGYYTSAAAAAAAVPAGSSAAEDTGSKSLVAGGQGWSSSVVSDAVTSTSASTVQQHSSVQLYNDVRVGIGGVSQAPSLSAVELPPSAIYRSSVIYQQTAAVSDDSSSPALTVSRKRRLDHSADDVLLAMNSGAAAAAAGTPLGLLPAAAPAALLPAMMSAVKRPALVDNKTGLPVYQPLPAAAAGSSPYHQLSAMPLAPQARYITLPVAGCPTVLPPF